LYPSGNWVNSFSFSIALYARFWSILFYCRFFSYLFFLVKIIIWSYIITQYVINVKF